MKKIVIEVIGGLSTKYGGVEIFMYRLAQQNPDKEFHLVYNKTPYSERFLKDLKDANVSVHIIDTDHWGFIKNYLKFKKLIKDIKPDIVHFHFGRADALWAPLCRRIGVKRIYKTIHGCLFYQGKQASKLSELGFKHNLLTRWGKLYKIYDSIFCVSEFVFNQFRKVYGDIYNAEISYLGTDSPKSFSLSEKESLKNGLNINEGQTILISILFATPIKGCDILIKALPFISRDFVLVLVGMNESLGYTSQMHSLAASLGVEDKIRWTGFTDEACKYLSISNIYIQPSRTEALSLAACEAASYKIPVVATNTGGLPEVASSLFEYEDYRGLAGVVNELLSNKENYSKQSDYVYHNWINTFSLQNGVKRYSEIYDETHPSHN